MWEWSFDSDTGTPALGDGELSWNTAEARSLAAYETTDGAVIPHPDGTPAGYLRLPAYASDGDFPLLSFNGSAANGGGAYLNQYTIVMDVYVPGFSDWLPFFNTNPANGNDADFYLAPDGALGIGNLGYSIPETLSLNAWHRIAFVADLGAGVVSYYRDGELVFQRTGDSLLDGRFALYSGADPGPDLLLGNEGDTGGVYTHEWLLAAFAFTDRTLSPEEIVELGAPSAAGIFISVPPPDPPQLFISKSGEGVRLDWSEKGLFLQRSGDLENWNTVPGSEGSKTYSESAAAGAAFFRLARP